jgi:hypothetical protein
MKIIPINIEEVTYKFHVNFSKRKKCCQDKDHEAYQNLRETNMLTHLSQMMINNQYLFFLTQTTNLTMQKHIHLN